VVTLKPISLNAVITLAIRPLVNANFTDNLLSQFICQILSIPALVYQLEQFCPEILKTFQSRELFEKCINLIYEKDNFKFISGSLQGAKLLALTANLIHLYHMEALDKSQELIYPQIILTMKLLFETIPDAVEQKGTCSQWHELLGWYNATTKTSDTAYENLSLIKKQVNLLWGHRLIKLLLGDYLKSVAGSLKEKDAGSSNDGASSSSSTCNSIIKKAIEFKSGIGKSSKSFKKLFDSLEIQRVATTCAMYHAALITLPQLKLDILSGICYNGNILNDLWTLINSIGMKGFLELIK
jgi:ubiquitin-protein ligase E3 B